MKTQMPPSVIYFLHKALPFKVLILSQIAPPMEDQVYKCMSPWGRFLFKPHRR